ncbi:MAG: hypothetical protein D6776_03710 [Planctomycetota bacterium]|nr:MAG: hypothetical protein D6776_03710 [Planctomycetota bacterium]
MPSVTTTACRHAELPAAFVPRSNDRCRLVPADPERWPAGVRHYRDLLALPGEVLKAERRTRIVRTEPQAGEPVLVVKVYRYGWLTGWRASAVLPKAEREYRALERLRALGLPAVEPVGFGLARTRTGRLRSCAVVTRHVPGHEPLRQWRKRVPDDERSRQRLAAIATRVGALLRRCHDERFYLLTPNAKNVLLEREPATDDDQDRVLLLDLPYARTLRFGLARRWAQARDLAQLCSSLPERDWPLALEALLAGYGMQEDEPERERLEQRVMRHVLVLRNRTPLSRGVHRLKRSVRHAVRRRRARSRRETT